MPADKRDLRSEVRAARARVPVEERSAAAEAVAERALSLPAVAKAHCVLAYAATPEELDPSPLVAALRARGARIAYPRACEGGALTLHWCDDDADLAPGYCGIAEPAADSPTASPDDFDLVLVPGVAFDETGARLGMGGGFYDRLLPRLTPGALTVGLAFDEQIVERVPREPHDVRLAAVITPTRTLGGAA